MIGEDAMDRYILRWIEARSHNYVIIALARSTMTPTPAYANVLRFKKPWFRDNRPLLLHPAAQTAGTPELLLSPPSSSSASANGAGFPGTSLQSHTLAEVCGVRA